MARDNLFKKSLMVWVIFLLIGTGVSSSISGNIVEAKIADKDYAEQAISSIINESVLDLQYIYNITEALSNIIFTEYNESAGEIAKGRYFGTKGEHRAAEILYENMTKLGLYTTLEQIKNTPRDPELTHIIEVLDYELRVNNKTVESLPLRTWLGPHHKPWKLSHTFNYSGLKVRLDHPSPKEGSENYVLLRKHGQQSNITFPLLDRLRIFGGFLKKLREYIKYPHCKGLLRCDMNNNTCNMWGPGTTIPIFSITGDLGKQMMGDIENCTVDFYLKQRYNKSVISYNVIGQLNGTDPSKTVIVDCLYDSWWCQGTGDSAIGMAMVLGIAKYFVDHNITPKYNIKFIGFGGEEVGLRGVSYYESTHKFENIKYVIDLNQLGFNQTEPRLTLEVFANNKKFLDEIWPVVERSDYVNRTGNVTDIKGIYKWTGHQSDDMIFATRRPFRCKTVCFLKNGDWIYHHRDGVNHTEGDVLKYFNWTDVSVTSEIILNVTKYLTVDP